MKRPAAYGYILGKSFLLKRGLRPCVTDREIAYNRARDRLRQFAPSEPDAPAIRFEERKRRWLRTCFGRQFPTIPFRVDLSKAGLPRLGRRYDRLPELTRRLWWLVEAVRYIRRQRTRLRRRLLSWIGGIE